MCYILVIKCKWNCLAPRIRLRQRSPLNSAVPASVSVRSASALTGGVTVSRPGQFHFSCHFVCSVPSPRTPPELFRATALTPLHTYYLGDTEATEGNPFSTSRNTWDPGPGSVRPFGAYDEFQRELKIDVLELALMVVLIFKAICWSAGVSPRAASFLSVCFCARAASDSGLRSRDARQCSNPKAKNRIRHKSLSVGCPGCLEGRSGGCRSSSL